MYRVNGAGDSPQHHSVLIFLFEGVLSLSFSAVADVLSAANSLAGDRFRYDVRTISRDGAAVRTSSGLTVLPDCGLAGSSEADTLLVPDAHAIPVSDAESVRTPADRGLGESRLWVRVPSCSRKLVCSAAAG